MWKVPLAHIVRLRILACRNDLNRKRIVSSQLVAFIFLPSPLTTAADPSLALWMTPYPPSSFWTEVRMLYKNEGNPQHDTEWRIYYHRWRLTVFPHHDNRSFTFVQDDALTFLYKDHGVGRQKELLAHVVRLRILACRNDLNRKRIVSL